MGRTLGHVLGTFDQQILCSIEGASDATSRPRLRSAVSSRPRLPITCHNLPQKRTFGTLGARVEAVGRPANVPLRDDLLSVGCARRRIQTVALLYVDGPSVPYAGTMGRSQTPIVQVTDLPALYARLSAKGVKFSGPTRVHSGRIHHTHLLGRQRHDAHRAAEAELKVESSNLKAGARDTWPVLVSENGVEPVHAVRFHFIRP